jgi:short-subunit dehydrogenase
MAAQGFNVCIVGRTKSKIDEKLKEISKRHPEIKTRCVIFDFSQLCTIQDYREKFAQPL